MVKIRRVTAFLTALPRSVAAFAAPSAVAAATSRYLLVNGYRNLLDDTGTPVQQWHRGGAAGQPWRLA